MERNRKFFLIFKRNEIKRNIPKDGLDIGLADKNLNQLNHVQGLKKKMNQ